MIIESIVRCRDCVHSGPRTKRKVAFCDLNGTPEGLDIPKDCAGYKARQDKPSQKIWKRNRAIWAALKLSGMVK